MTPRLPASLRSAIAAIAVWADLIALGVLPSAAAVIAFALGLRAEVFLVILGASLMLNITLAGLAIRWRRKLHVAKALARRISDVFLAPTEDEISRARPSSWLTDPLDLGTLQLDNAALEESLSKATAKAKEVLAADAQAELVSVKLMPEVEVYFRANSARALKSCTITVAPEGASATTPMREVGPLRPLDEPWWRTNPDWIELVQVSWARETPFRGAVELYRSKRIPGGWELAYSRLTEIGEPPTRYAINGTEVRKLLN